MYLPINIYLSILAKYRNIFPYEKSVGLILRGVVYICRDAIYIYSLNKE
jgi:hypothetical protein